jgi:uncharacterized protein (DUF3820 family)
MSETAITAVGSPDQFIQTAITQGLSVEHLERLMALQERWQANQAKASFLDALNLFQSSVPVLEKKKQVKFNTTNYKYAPLGEIAETIKDTMKLAQLSYRWEFEDRESQIVCTCIVSHSLGHSERTSMSAGKDSSGNKNDIQSRGSTMTYLQRYTLIAALGITTADEDVDGRRMEQDEPERKQKYNTHTGEIHPQPETVSKNGKNVSFNVFDPKVEQIAFGKYSGVEWIALDKGYLEWIVKNGQPDSKMKAEATLKYLENGQSQIKEVDDLAEVFDNKEPEVMKINDSQKKTKALIAIGKASTEKQIEAVVKTAAQYLDTGELTEETHKEIMEMVESRRKSIGGTK